MKTTKKNFDSKKKLLTASTSLLISAAMLGTSTYAWFTMNKTVTVDGMQMRTKVGSNLLITTDKIGQASDNVDSKYTTDIQQEVKALLEPSSTINGVNYWYTVEASADGKKLDGKNWIEYSELQELENTAAVKAKYDKTFNQKYTTYKEFTADTIKMTDSNDGAAYGYIDYDFYIKATSDAADQKVVMTKCNLLHNEAALGKTDEDPQKNIDDRAWRVALFSKATTVSTEVDDAAAVANLVTILAPASAVNQTPGKAVSSATEVADLTKSGAKETPDKAVVGTIATAGATQYYKVTVRLWLEGEDKTCTSETYAKLTSDYCLDLEFKIADNDNAAVTTIGSDASWHAVKHPSGS